MRKNKTKQKTICADVKLKLLLEELLSYTPFGLSHSFQEPWMTGGEAIMYLGNHKSKGSTCPSAQCLSVLRLQTYLTSSPTLQRISDI